MDGFIFYGTKGIEAADDDTKKYLEKHMGEVLAVTFCSKDISLAKHRLFIMVLKKCVNSMDSYNITNNAEEKSAIEDMIIKLKYAVGHTVEKTLLTGEKIQIPKPINFKDCPEGEREEYREKSYNVLAQIMGCDKHLLFDFDAG